MNGNEGVVIVIVPTLPIEDANRMLELWCRENASLLESIDPGDIEKEYIRGAEGATYARVCLTLRHADDAGSDSRQ